MEWYWIVLIAYVLYGIRVLLLTHITNNLRTKRDKVEAIIWIFIPLSMELTYCYILLKDKIK